MEPNKKDEKISNTQLMNLIYSIINWENNKENLLNNKDTNKEINFFLIDKEYYNKLKKIINYEQIISNFDNLNINSNDEKQVKEIIEEQIKNNINESNFLKENERYINENLIIKELIENKNFTVEIINEDIKKNLNLKEKKFIQLKSNYIDEEIYFTCENYFSDKKLIIMFLFEHEKIYEIILIVDDNNYEALIEIIKEEKNNILNKCDINIRGLTENSIIKNIQLSNIDFCLFISVISQFKTNKAINKGENESITKPKTILIKKEKLLNLNSLLKNSNELFNRALNKNIGELHNNYSPCKIINKFWVERFLHLDNSMGNFEQINCDIFGDYKLLIPSNYDNEDIFIINEIFFLSLFPFFDELYEKRELFKDYIIYLNDDKGAIIIDNEIFIFETLQNDVNQRKNFIKIKEPMLFLEEMKKCIFKLNNDNWKKMMSNINGEYFKESNINNNYKDEKTQINPNNQELHSNINNLNANLDSNNIFPNNNIYNNFNINPIYNNQNISFNYNNNFNNFNSNNNNIINNNYNITNNIINQYYNNNKNNDKVILDKFMPTIGLKNIGATCYINAIIQCLAHCIEFSEDFLSWYLYQEDKNKKSRSISYSFANVLYNLYFPQENQNDFSAKDFREIIALFGPLFEENQANDSKDIFQFLIEKMHEELNELNNNNNINYDEDAQVNQFDELATFNQFELMYQKNYHSIISKHFYSKQKSMTKCLNCGNIIYNFQVYSFLMFPLKDVKIYTLSYPNQNQNQILNLYDCFNYLQKTELFTGDNLIYCRICQAESNANFCNFIYSTPTILAIVLNRGKNNQDFNEKFLFPTELNLENYTQDKTTSNRFYLIGVICHVGESGNFGHFFAYCRSHYQSFWYKYNDSIVSECNENEIFMQSTPYILFYHKYI